LARSLADQRNSGKHIVTRTATAHGAHLKYNLRYEQKNPDWDFQ
jgi:hypothetical protein